MASWRQGLVAGGLLLACTCAQAAVHMQAATLSVPGMHLSGLRVDAALGPDGRPTLRLDARKVSIPALGWRDVSLKLQGEPQRAAGGAWKFVGHVAAQRAPGAALGDADLVVLYDGEGGTLEVGVTQGKTALDAQMPLDQTSHVQMKLAAVPLAWLRGLLAAAWPDGRLDGGSVDGDVALDLATAATRASGRINIKGADLDSKDGTVAAQKLGAEGTFRIDTGVASTSVMFDGNLGGGQLLLGPLYAQLPQDDVGLHVSGSFGATGIVLDSLEFDDPGALRIGGSLGFDRRGNLDTLDLKHFAATLPQAYARYGTTLVQRLTGLQALATAGSLSGSLAFDGGEPRAFALTAQDLAIDSHGGSLAVDDLDGSVDWSAGATRPATQVKWNALSIYRIAFGPARLGLHDDAGTLGLRTPASVGLLGGAFQLQRFAWRPGAGKSQDLSAAFAVIGVDVDALCSALGWPAFGGKLGGAVPDVSYHGGELVFGGGLSLNVFGGSVSVTNLGMQHLFGATPELAADIDISQLDLAQLTSVFNFGQISGRMDGGIHGLKLVDWKPSAFTADLTANDGGKISQNAIKNLTQVGGGGIAGGLQGMALRLFKTFGYARLGLSCTLAQGVCSMGGITPDPDPNEGGYTIVEGSGLPRITVIGHETAVDWATLVGRLKVVTESNAPVIK